MQRDAHVEPLTDTPMRGHGQCREFFRPRDSQRSLVIIDQVYTSPSCQESIYELLAAFLQSGKLELVLVEGAEGNVTLVEANRGRSFKELAEDTQIVVSPGVVRFLEQPNARVLGVDDRQLMDDHWKTVRISTRWEEGWIQLSEDVEVCLARARTRLYSDDMLWLSQCLRTDSELPLGAKVGGLVRIARSVGLEVEHFPAVCRFVTAIRAEQSLDFSAVQQERSAYVRALSDRLATWWDKRRGRPAVTFDEVQPALEYWLGATGGDGSGDGNGKGAPVDLERTLSTCADWILGRLANDSIRFRANEVTYGGYYTDVITLGLRLQLDVFRYPNLLRYLQYVEVSALSPTALMSEVEILLDATMDQLVGEPHARELRVLDDEFRILERAGRRALTPRESNRFYHDVNWRNLIARLAKLVPEANKVKTGRWVDDATRAAYEYCEISGRRQKVMLEATLDQLSTGDVSTAALVCGGFHATPIAQILREDRPDLGWSHVTPKMDTSDVPQDRKSRGKTKQRSA